MTCDGDGDGDDYMRSAMPMRHVTCSPASAGGAPPPSSIHTSMGVTATPERV